MNNKVRGFTLIEVMVSISVLSLMMMFLFYMLNFNIRNTQQEQGNLEGMQNVRLAQSILINSAKRENFSHLLYDVNTRILSTEAGPFMNLSENSTYPGTVKYWYCYNGATGNGQLRDNSLISGLLVDKINIVAPQYVPSLNCVKVKIRPAGEIGNYEDTIVYIPLYLSAIATSTPLPVNTPTPATTPIPTPIMTSTAGPTPIPTQTSITTPAPTPTPLFFDGFENDNTNKWFSISSSKIVNNRKYTGRNSLSIYANGALNGYAALTLNTVGKSNIKLNYVLLTRQSNEKKFTCEWNNGSVWQTLETVTADVNWSSRTFALGPGASNNPSFSIRFSSNFDSADCCIDDVEVTGGEYGK